MIDTPVTQPRSGPVRYELIDKDGVAHGPFTTAKIAVGIAMATWPDQEQDPELTGKGWDVQVMGAEQ